MLALSYLCPFAMLIAPLRYGLRIAAAVIAAILLVATFASSPNAPGAYDGLGMAVFYLSGTASLLALTLRGVAERFWPILRLPFAHRDSRALSWLTNAVIAAWSALFGLWTTNAFAFGFAESSGGQTLHLWVAATAGIAAAAALILTRNRLRMALFPAMITVTALCLYGAFAYPGLIRARAETLANGQPYCLALGQTLTAPKSRDDLMFLTLPKTSRGHSSAILVLSTPDGPMLYHWSFRARAFHPGAKYHNPTPPCTPSNNPLSFTPRD